MTKALLSIGGASNLFRVDLTNDGWASGEVVIPPQMGVLILTTTQSELDRSMQLGYRTRLVTAEGLQLVSDLWDEPCKGVLERLADEAERIN